MARLSTSSNIDGAAACLEALGSPTRLQALRILVRAGDTGLAVGQLQRRLGGIAPSTLSHHLQRLTAVGLVTQERKGVTLVCRVDCQAIAKIIGFLTEECSAEVDPIG
jgi:DNA-binding transcriptional ArsR family regulator